MRVLFFLGFPNPFPGAGWTRIGFFSNYFVMRGHAVIVLGAFSYKSMNTAGAKNEGQIGLRNVIFTLGLRHPLAFLLNMASSFVTSTIFLVVWKPKVVIVALPRGDTGLGCIAASFFLRKKIIIDYCDEWEDYALSLADLRPTKHFYQLVKKLVSYFYRRALVACVTPNICGSLAKRGIENILSIPNGVDTTIFKPEETKKDHKEFRIFFSGGVGAYYKVDLVVRALKQMKSNISANVKFMIAGKGDIAVVLALASELGLRRRVEYVGAIYDKNKLSKMLAQADIGVIPYDDNTFLKNTIPLKFLEYCACGLPVVATTHEDSLLAKLITQNQIGEICRPLDVSGLAKVVERLAKDKDFRIEASKRARLLVEQSFDMNKIAEDFLNAVEKVVES